MLHHKRVLNLAVTGAVMMLLAVTAFVCAAEPAIIPQPQQMEVKAGKFTLSGDTRIHADKTAAETAELLAVRLRAATGFAFKVDDNTGANTGIAIRQQSIGYPKRSEHYRLEVTGNEVSIHAPTDAGLFYGTQTLLQLLPPEILSSNKVSRVKWEIPCVEISDWPRFAWRGLMLDCSRTFQSVDYLHKTIDRLAAYKMNVLHLHLTDDQGWRMEIKKHPELTQKGARFSVKYNEQEAHQGFYTQQQLRELVSYAAARHVTIVPEIEMSGHSHEVMVCRPDLSCAGATTNGIFPFGKGPNITRDVFCAGNDESFRFLEDVLDEVMEIFPSPFIHIGGDEVPKDSWKACPKCQARMKAEDLKDEHELQSYFIRRIEKYLNSRSRRLIGWSEILQGGLAPNAAVMDWIGGAASATKAGHDVVMSPTGYCYFDYPYNEISSKHAYSFEPCAGLAPEQAKHILGLQANFWSHIDREPELVDKQLFPRLLAIAERGWSPAEVRDWPALKERLQAQLPRLRQMGVNYCTNANAL